MNVEKTGQSSSTEVLYRAVRKLLRPLIRFLLSKGITYPAFSNLVKAMYVQIASEEFALEHKRQTDSRISMLTGIQRREVKRLSEATPWESVAPTNVSFGAQIVARWITDPTYLDRMGKPLPLARTVREGDDLSFEALAASVSKDIRARPVLDEWLRLGAAHLDEQNRVHLNATSFVPTKGFEEKAYYFGFNLHDHIAASVHNVLDEGPPMLERTAYYDRLTAESVEKLRKLAADLGANSIQKIVGKAMRLETQDSSSPDAHHRMTFGVYFFTEPTRHEVGAIDVTHDPDKTTPAKSKKQAGQK